MTFSKRVSRCFEPHLSEKQKKNLVSHSDFGCLEGSGLMLLVMILFTLSMSVGLDSPLILTQFVVRWGVGLTPPKNLSSKKVLIID